MTININGTPIDSLAKIPNLDGTEKFPSGRTWIISCH